MAYKRVNWENLPSTKTPVNADNLNKTDEGIANVVDEVKNFKTQLYDNRLPMTRISSNIGDNSTITTSIEKNRPYIFINSHIYNREIVLITIYNSNINVDRIINTGSTDLSSFTLKDDKLTIKGASRCKGTLYRLDYQICA